MLKRLFGIGKRVTPHNERKLAEFNKMCDAIVRNLHDEWRAYGATRGLCYLITDYISYNAKMWFNYEFSTIRWGGSHYGYWLGSPRDFASFKRRLLYVEKFRQKAIKTRAYLEWL